MTELLSLKQESNVCIVYHQEHIFHLCTFKLENSARAKVVENGKSPEGEGEGKGGGRRVSRTNYLDGPILVDIANVRIIAFVRWLIGTKHLHE